MSSKIKEIIGIVAWTLLIFITQKLMTSTSGGDYNQCFFLGMLLGKAVSYFGGMKGRAKAKFRDTWRIREARGEAKRSQDELGRWKNMYSNLAMSNPYVNMENTMEDLTINQKQTQFERQTFQQSQKNILSALRPKAGAGGVASLAQALVRQGETSQQQMAAGIAQQQTRNRQLALQQRERIQMMGRQGERISADFRNQQIGAMMGLTQQEYEMNKDLQQQQYGIAMDQQSSRIQSNLSSFNTLLGAMPG